MIASKVDGGHIHREAGDLISLPFSVRKESMIKRNETRK
jgi:hypothetical protein